MKHIIYTLVGLASITLLMLIIWLVINIVGSMIEILAMLFMTGAVGALAYNVGRAVIYFFKGDEQDD